MFAKEGRKNAEDQSHLYKKGPDFQPRDCVIEKIIELTSWEYDVRNLRAKLGDDPENPRYIASVRGVGYKLREEE